MNQEAEFLRVIRSFDEDISESIAESLLRLTRSLISNDWSPSTKLRSLKQISVYLQKKADELDFTLVEMNELNLRKIRNELAHGRSPKGKDFSALYPALWNAISKLGRILEPKQLEDLLAYTIGMDNLSVFKNHATSSRVIAVYKPFFNSLDPNEKRRVFAELLLRLFSDNESLGLLGSTRRK